MRISVCIATFNGEEFIRDQVDSILKQIGDEDEIIISDDKSTDNTLNLLKSYNDKRIKIHINEFKSGVVSNFENALSNASGDIIFLSDQDDVWESSKVKIMLADLSSSDAVLTVSNCRIFENNLSNVIVDSFFKFNNTKAGFFSNLYSNGFMGCCMAFKKSILNKALPFPTNLIMHDWWLGLIAFKCGKVIFNNSVLLNYRKHSNFSDTANGISRFSFFVKVKMRLIIMINLVKRNLFA